MIKFIEIFFLITTILVNNVNGKKSVFQTLSENNCSNRALHITNDLSYARVYTGYALRFHFLHLIIIFIMISPRVIYFKEYNLYILIYKI